MEQVFGQIFICDDQATAKKISQMRNGYICVTRDGDRYEPTGILSGGSNVQSIFLKKVQEYNAKEIEKKQVAKVIYDMKN